MRDARITACLIAALVGGAGLGAPARAALPADGSPSSRVLVKWTGADDPELVRSARASEVLDERFAGLRRLGVRVYEADDARGAAAHLARNPRVAYAEVDGWASADVTPDDPSWAQQWGPRQVGAPAAWDLTTGSSAVTIAVLDTGVDTSADGQVHVDLRKVDRWRDYVAGRTVPYDDHGHGTRSAGVATAVGGNATGVAGLCWTCRLDVRKVLDSTGSGAWSTVSSAIVDAADAGASVISMSLSGATGSQALSDATAYAVQKGALLVGSAGNVGDTAVRYPSGYADVLAVAGNDEAGARYAWSTHGSWVDVTAPGCNETTALSGTYGTFCGTSSATPLVAGIAGLLRSRGLDAAQTWSALTSTAVPTDFVRSGRVDAAAALALPTGPATQPPPAPTAEQAPTAPAGMTTTLTGSVGGKGVVTRSLTAGAGPASAVLRLTKASSLRVRVLSRSGTVLHDDVLPAGVQHDLGSWPAGTQTIELSGSRTAFEMDVVHTTP